MTCRFHIVKNHFHQPENIPNVYYEYEWIINLNMSLYVFKFVIWWYGIFHVKGINNQDTERLVICVAAKWSRMTGLGRTWEAATWLGASPVGAVDKQHCHVACHVIECPPRAVRQYGGHKNWVPNANEIQWLSMMSTS